MTKDEVLQQALEALNKLTDVFLDTEGNHGDYEQKALNQGNKTILAIKAALAQPEQEPVAWTVAGQVRDWGKDFSAYQTQHYVRPIYTSPPQREWVGLTDDEIDAALGVYDSFGGRLDARKIEAKLKEKNT